MTNLNDRQDELIDRIKALMKEQDINQTKLAKKSGITQGTMNRLLNKKIDIQPTTLEKIAGGLGLTLLELCEEEEESPTQVNLNGYIEYQGKITRITNLKVLRNLIDGIEEAERLAAIKQNKLPKQAPILLEDIDFFKWEEIDATQIEVKSFKSGEDIVEGEKFNIGNMCPGYPFVLNAENFYNSEEAYIAGMFSNNTPEHLAIQKELQVHNNGYDAKKGIRKRNEVLARKDWETFNVEWMKFVVWNKCKTNAEFAKKLIAVPKTAMIVENSTGMTGKTAQFWGCFNKYLMEIRDAKEKKYRAKHPKASKEEANEEKNRWCNFGVWSGTDMMGKILKACSICLQTGIELPIDYELLRSKHIFLLGKEVVFPDTSTKAEENKAIIIDLDNTLIDTNALAPYYEPIKKAKQNTPEYKAAWEELFKHIPECKRYDGMDEAWEYIKANDVKVCLVSNSPLTRIEKLVKAFDIPITKENMVGGFSCGNRYKPIKKPDPRPILKGIEIMGVAPENVVVIGNSPDDIQAAKNAGVMSVGCQWGNTEQENTELLSSSPDKVIEKPTDIIKVIKGEM